MDTCPIQQCTVAIIQSGCVMVHSWALLNTTQCTAAIIRRVCVMVHSWGLDHSVLRQLFKVGVS